MRGSGTATCALFDTRPGVTHAYSELYACNEIKSIFRDVGARLRALERARTRCPPHPPKLFPCNVDGFRIVVVVHVILFLSRLRGFWGIGCMCMTAE